MHSRILSPSLTCLNAMPYTVVALFDAVQVPVQCSLLHLA